MPMPIDGDGAYFVSGTYACQGETNRKLATIYSIIPYRTVPYPTSSLVYYQATKHHENW